MYRSCSPAYSTTNVVYLGSDCPAIVAYRVSWPDERLIRGTLADIRDKVKTAGITRTALVLVGRALGDGAAPDSRLYAADHHHLMRLGRETRYERDDF